MSMKLMVRAMNTVVGNPIRKLVLIKLADNANDSGECFPSYRHIADQCEINRSTVRRHIKDLESQGFLKLENRKGQFGHTSNAYKLNLPPVGTKSTPVGTESTDVLTEGTPPVGTESTITSHSLEPVIEPPPYDGIADLYNEILGESLPRVVKLSTPRKKAIRARWKNSEHVRTLEWWRWYFECVSRSDFLMGRRKGFRATFDWLINENNLIKVVEGNYDNRG